MIAIAKYTTGIYQIYNKQTKKTYIGKSVDVRSRINQHFRELRKNEHCNKFLQKEFNTFGEDSFKVSILVECNENDLDNFESHYCYEYDVWNRKKGYNIAKLRKMEKAKTKSELLKDKFLELLFSNEKLQLVRLIEKFGEVELPLWDLEDIIEGFDYKLIKKILKWINPEDWKRYSCHFRWGSRGFEGIILKIQSIQKHDE